MNPSLPTAPSLRTTTISPSFAAVLEVLEHAPSVSIREAAELSGFSTATVTRVMQALTRVGILEWQAETATHRHCHAVLPAPVGILPVVDLSAPTPTVYAANLRLTPLGATVMPRNPDVSAEENLRMLCRRGLVLLRGCSRATGLFVLAPTVILPRETVGGGLPADRITAIVADELGVSPFLLIAREKAVARALQCDGIPRTADSLLFLQMGDRPAVTLFERSGVDGWTVCPAGRHLEAALSPYLPAEHSHPAALQRSVTDFLADLYRFIRPDCIRIEDPRRILSDMAWRSVLSDGVEVIAPSDESDGLTAVCSGALRLGRRFLWERILINQKD